MGTPHPHLSDLIAYQLATGAPAGGWWVSGTSPPQAVTTLFPRPRGSCLRHTLGSLSWGPASFPLRVRVPVCRAAIIKSHRRGLKQQTFWTLDVREPGVDSPGSSRGLSPGLVDSCLHGDMALSFSECLCPYLLRTPVTVDEGLPPLTSFYLYHLFEDPAPHTF